MATFLTQTAGKNYLDSLLNLEIALYTVPPTEVAGTGTEVVGGGYARQAYSTGVAVDGSTGETARRVASTVLFTNMPVASTDVLGLALIDSVTGDVVVVDDSFTPTVSFAVGGNYVLNTLTLFTEK